MKRNYWSIFFALVLLLAGGVTFFFVQKQSDKEVVLETLIDDETSQVCQLNISSLSLLNKLNGLESDDMTKNLFSQMNDFVTTKVTIGELSGNLSFLFANSQLQTIFIELDEVLSKDWVVKNGFKKVSNGLYSNEAYFLKFYNEHLAISKSKTRLLNSEKKIWKSKSNKESAIGLMDLSRGFTIDFYLENNILNQYKSIGEFEFESYNSELSILKFVPDILQSFQLKKKEIIEELEGPVTWMGEEFVEMDFVDGKVAVVSYSGLFHPDELIEEWIIEDSLNQSFLIGDIQMKPIGPSFEYDFLKSYHYVGRHEDFIVFSDSKRAIKKWYLSVVSKRSTIAKKTSWIPSNFESYYYSKTLENTKVMNGHFYGKSDNMSQVFSSKGFSCSKLQINGSTFIAKEEITNWSLLIGKPILGQQVELKEGSGYYLIQDIKNDLHLIDSKGVLLWSKKILGKIIDKINVVKLDKGDKVNFIFNTASHFYLLNQKGIDLSGYPIKLPTEASGSVAVLDYDKNRNFRFAICSKSGDIYNFNKSGKPVNGWGYKSQGVPIKSKLEHFVVEGKDYIQVIDTSGVLSLIGRDGSMRSFDSIKLLQPYLFVKGKTASDSRYYQLTKNGIKTTSLMGQDDLLPAMLDGVKFITTYHSEKSNFFVGIKNGHLILINHLGIIEMEIPLVDSNVSKIKFISNITGDLTYFVISDDKNLYLYNNNGVLQSGYPVETESVFYLNTTMDETLNTVVTYVQGQLKSEVLLK